MEDKILKRVDEIASELEPELRKLAFDVHDI